MFGPLLGITTFAARAEPQRNMSGPQTRSPYLAGSRYQARDDLEKREGFLVTRVGTVGTTLSTDDLEKREDFVATAVGTVGTSLSTNCTYGLSDKKREEESISWTRYWYKRTRTAIKEQEGLLAGLRRSKKREDEISDWHRYWYEQTRVPVLVTCEYRTANTCIM